MLKEKNLKKALGKIKSIMKRDNLKEITIERKYLPEVFDTSLIEFLIIDGLPVVKPAALNYFLSKGIVCKIDGHSIEFHEATSPVDRLFAYQFNAQKGEFEDVLIDPNVNPNDLLDAGVILYIKDPKHYRVWLWHGRNIATRMKFIALKVAPQVRDEDGITYKLTAVEQGKEPREFKRIMGIK